MPAASHVEKEGTFTNTQRLRPVARQGARPAGRRALGAVVHAPPGQAREGALRAARPPQRDWPIAQPARGTTPSTARARAGRRGRAARRSTATTWRPGAPRVAASPSSRTTARPPAAAGSTAASTPTASTRRGAATPATSTRPAAGSRPSGAGRGRPTAASSTTAPRPTPRPARGRSASATSGGTSEQERWTGYDVPDFPVDKPPGLPGAARRAQGMDAISGTDPFIMMADGRGWLYSPSGLLDGPLPTHYEPIESPVAQPAVPGDRREPGGAPLGARRTTRTRRPDDPRYPLVATTFRLTEHHTAGGDEPQPAVAGRAAAGDVRRDRPRPRRASAGSRTAAG